MKQTHMTERNAPMRQRPPHGSGWSRRSTGAGAHGDIVWRMWRPITDSRESAMYVVSVPTMSIVLRGRVYAAQMLRESRVAFRRGRK